MPADCICDEEMCEKLRNNAKTVRLQTMDRLVVVHESLLEEISPHTVQLAESLANHAIELLIGPFLTGTFHNHGSEFPFESVRKVYAHEFVATFFKPSATLDGQVYRPAQIDEIGIRLVLDFHSFLFLIIFVFR
jgi:hypothetical protein